MDDDQLISQIDALVDEEHQLHQRHPEGLDGAEHQRLRELEVRLDQCWDLLRQRRARRDAGQPADDAASRSERTVEGYQQ